MDLLALSPSTSRQALVLVTRDSPAICLDYWCGLHLPFFCTLLWHAGLWTAHLVSTEAGRRWRLEGPFHSGLGHNLC